MAGRIGEGLGPAGDAAATPDRHRARSPAERAGCDPRAARARGQHRRREAERLRLSGQRGLHLAVTVFVDADGIGHGQRLDATAQHIADDRRGQRASPEAMATSQPSPLTGTVASTTRAGWVRAVTAHSLISAPL